VLKKCQGRFTRQPAAWTVYLWLRAFWFIKSRARELTIFSSSKSTVATPPLRQLCSDARRALCNRVPMRRRRRQDILEPYHPREFDGGQQRTDHAEQPPKARRTGDTDDPRSSRATTVNGGRSRGACRRREKHRGPIINTGKQRKAAPNGGNCTAKPEMTTS
jgi:hypothetical protein